MKKSAQGRTLRRLALACTLALAASAHAQGREFDVAAGDMKAALDAYIAQAGVQLRYKIDDIKGVSTKGLKGNLPPEEALARLLEGTRLKLRRDASGAIAIYLAPPDDTKPRAEPSQLEGVVITATRRREPVREIPMQVAVLQSEALERAGSRTLGDYLADQPGVDLAHNGPFPGSLSIRGLTAGNQTVATVGVYVDDVATGSSAPYGTGAFTPLDMGLLDLKHLEILRGPQGTLYGAGAMGGVLKYVTNEPDTGEFAGSARLGVSSTRYGGIGYTANGVINVPVKTDVAAVRIAAFQNKFGGYDDAVGPAAGLRVNRGRTEGARISALLTPSKDLTLRLSATTQEARRDGNDLEDLNPVTGQFVEGERRRRLLVKEPSHTRNNLFGLDVEYNFGWARLNAITSAQDVDLYARADISSSYVPALIAAKLPALSAWADSTSQQHRLSQEFRLTSRASRDIEWLAGLYINRERATTFGGIDAEMGGGLGTFNLFTTQKPSTYRELAGYGNLTWHATPALALTGGVRVGRNKQTFKDTSSGLLAGGAATAPSGGESTETATTWLATASYKLGPLSNIYARAASGYRPGGPNGLQPNTSAAVPRMFESDSLWSYEFGYKANLLDRTLAVEAAVYDIEWRDIQQRMMDNGLGFFTNAGNARIRGAELALNWTPSAAWRLDASLSTIDAKLLTEAKGLVANAGERLPFSARFSGSLSATHNFSLAGHQAYLGLQAGIEFQRFSLSAYVRNLSDSRGLASFGYSAPTLGTAVVVEPRTIGLSLGTAF